MNLMFYFSGEERKAGGGGYFFDRTWSERLVVSNVNSSQKSKSIRALLELLIILAKNHIHYKSVVDGKLQQSKNVYV